MVDIAVKYTGAVPNFRPEAAFPIMTYDLWCVFTLFHDKDVKKIHESRNLISLKETGTIWTITGLQGRI